MSTHSICSYGELTEISLVLMENYRKLALNYHPPDLFYGHRTVMISATLW